MTETTQPPALPRRSQPGMRTRAVTAAAGVLQAAMEQGRQTPTGLAIALDSARLLNSPEHAARLVALQNDALAIRGALAPADGSRKVPFELGETLTPAVDWLIARVAELEALLAEYERPIDEDPIPYALTEQAPLTIYRASHDSIVMGLYRTAAEARKHCETEERRAWAKHSAPTNFDWIEDEEDGVTEMTAWVGGEECTTGYVVTELEVAAAYDEEADV